MARSINGNLLGKASQIEAQDFQDSLHKKEDGESLAAKIMELIPVEEYMKWFSSTPETDVEYIQACEDKLAELENKSILEWVGEPLQLVTATQRVEMLIHEAEHQDWLAEKQQENDLRNGG